MIFRTMDNLTVVLDRPSAESLERETWGQMHAMQDLRRELTEGPGAPDFLFAVSRLSVPNPILSRSELQ